MITPPRRLELLAPAGSAEIAIEAIRHGADAVYIGPPSHGARKAVSNSLEDIKRVVDFAHIFQARVYVTVNTIIFNHELKAVENMIRDLYRIGVDALIVQDMGILRLDIPPIALHASTQCDIRTPEKARFLQEAGFSQLVLARELSVVEIKEICKSVSVPVETFIHGALCVSYSGRCGAGFAAAGRSGNRGECPQICRQAFTLTDVDGKVLARDRYLLSLKDFRADRYLDNLVEAGVSSFKIEGRLKEVGYVKNVVAYYSRQLDRIVERSEGRLERSSFGHSELTFTPRLEKSFNRGFTSYNLSGRVDPKGVASILTPKSLGEKISDVNQLRPGDGISFFDSEGEFSGVQVNGVKSGKIIGNRPFRLPHNAEIFRTSSIEWKKLMAGDTAKRRLRLNVEFDATGVSASDETGAFVRLPLPDSGEPARNPVDYRKVFEKLGNTPFLLYNYTQLTDPSPQRPLDSKTISLPFFPLSDLTALRRSLVEKLLETKRMVYPYDYRKKENRDFPYPEKSLDYRDNVANRLAERFYRDHGVKKIEPALETGPRSNARGKVVMTTRHCILRELGLCKKEGHRLREPLILKSGNLRLIPIFDCASCQMHLRTP